MTLPFWGYCFPVGLDEFDRRTSALAVLPVMILVTWAAKLRKTLSLMLK